MIEDMKFGAMLGKIRQATIRRPTALDMLRCATVNAARAQRRSHDLGTLKPGHRGDAVVVGLQSVFNRPVFDPIRNLVYYSSIGDVRHTLVDGRPIVQDGDIVGVDVPATCSRANAAVTRLLDLAQERGALKPPTW
jgi:5-methylthioadenosine/S-adenosylhomocysteine deaminase